MSRNALSFGIPENLSSSNPKKEGFTIGVYPILL
jgi:hypothetical protein